MNVTFSGLQVSRGVSDWFSALAFLYFCADFSCISALTLQCFSLGGLA